MNVESGIWWNTHDENEDGESARGDIVIEVAEADSIIIHFRVDGEVIANAEVDRFMAGALVGQLMSAAAEAVPA